MNHGNRTPAQHATSTWWYRRAAGRLLALVAVSLLAALTPVASAQPYGPDTQEDASAPERGEEKDAPPDLGTPPPTSSEPTATPVEAIEPQGQPGGVDHETTGDQAPTAGNVSPKDESQAEPAPLAAEPPSPTPAPQDAPTATAPDENTMATPSSGAEPQGSESPQPTTGAEVAASETPGQQGLTPSEIFARAADSVVIVKTDDGIGAGFLVRDDRTIATAFHVIERGGPITVVARNGRSYTARVFAYDQEHDLATLTLDRPFDLAPPLPLAPPRSTHIGDPVVAIGHPFGSYSTEEPFKGLLTWTVTSGVVGAIGEASIQTDAAINPGNSGGPLLDRQGRIVGVVTSKLRDAQSVGFAVPVTFLTPLLEKKEPSPQLLPPRGRVVGIGFGNLQTLEGLQMDGLLFSFIQVARNKGSRVGLSLGYNTVADVPSSGAYMNFEENLYWIQAEWGPRFFLPPLGHVADILVAGRVGWWEREKLSVSATTTDPRCDLNGTTPCELTFVFDTNRRAGFRIYGLGAIVVPLSTIEIGFGALLDPTEEPTARWTAWVSLLL